MKTEEAIKKLKNIIAKGICNWDEETTLQFAIIKLEKKKEIIIIRDEIRVTQKFIDETIEEYKKLKKNFGIGMLGYFKNRDEIIEEIKNLTEFGKEVLVMKINFKKYNEKMKNGNKRSN